MKKSRPTLGLAMIMKDEVEEFERIVDECGEYFDKIYLTATFKKTHDILLKKIADKHPAYEKVELSYFKWIDHFGKARLYNHSQIKTDYWMCIDPDDEIVGAENLQKVIEYMIAKNLDATVFPYETPRRTNLMDPVTIGWRERVIRTASGLKWSDKPIHENIYIEGDTDMLVKDVVVKHRRTAAEKLNSGDRNKKILEKEWQHSPSAEIAKYLGATLMDFGDLEGAIEKIVYSAEHYESRAEKFRAWRRLSDCYARLGRYSEAFAAADECINLDPDHPAPWYQKFMLYQATGFHNAAMYCAEIAMTKRNDGELAILLGSDPAEYEYRMPFVVARSYLTMGNVERAYELYQQVEKSAPGYIDELSNATDTPLKKTFEDAYDEFKSKPQTLNSLRLKDLDLLVYARAFDGKPREGSADETELNYLFSLAKLPDVKKIAEIGFNAGKSSYAFLAAKPDTTVVAFDLGEYDYVSPAKKIIDNDFPDRHELILGDSTETVPEYHKTHPKLKFDLIFVDGGHSYEIAKKDIENMKRFAHKDTVVVIDDLTPWLPWGEGPSRAWNEAIDEGLVIQDELVKDGMIIDKIEPPGNRIYARGRYILSADSAVKSVHAKTKKKHEMSRPTLGLTIIMKDEIDDIKRIVNDYGKYFDKLYVTVTDKKTHTKLVKHFADKPVDDNKLELSYFKWIDHFGKARNYNLQQVKTDYWMWIDTDDEIEGAENILQVLENMVKNDLDVVWFQYDYIRRANFSEPETLLWRERIVKTAPNLAWGDVAVHETLDEAIQGDVREELDTNVMIKHRRTTQQTSSSQSRNKAILEKDWEQKPNAVTGYYLGGTLRELGDYEGAIEKLTYAATHSDIKPVKFGSWQGLCDCYIQTNNHDAALSAISECIAIDPDHPGPWYQKFTVYWAMGHHNAALYAAETAISKKIQGNLDLVSKDVSWYRYKGPFKVAQAYLAFGNIERAYELYCEVKQIAPQYIDEQSTPDTQWKIIFEEAYDKFKNKVS